MNMQFYTLIDAIQGPTRRQRTGTVYILSGKEQYVSKSDHTAAYDLRGSIRITMFNKIIR